MSSRIAAALIGLLCLAAPALAREPVAVARPGSREEAALSPARERQKRCAGEWRGLSAAEKAARGPAWPQFYSQCVKRLKAQKA